MNIFVIIIIIGAASMIPSLFYRTEWPPDTWYEWLPTITIPLCIIVIIGKLVISQIKRLKR